MGAAKGRAEVLLGSDVAGRRRDREPSLLALLFRPGVFDVGRKIQHVHVIEAGPFVRRLERAIPSAEHRDQALPEKTGASDHDSLARAVQNVGVALVLLFVHGNSSGKPARSRTVQFRSEKRGLGFHGEFAPSLASPSDQASGDWVDESQVHSNGPGFDACVGCGDGPRIRISACPSSVA